MSKYALGLIETRGLISTIEATDAAAKAAAVVVASVEYTGASMMIIRIEGELGAVQASVEAAAQAVERIGELVAVHVIPNPDDGLSPLIPTKVYNSQFRPGDDRPPLSYDSAPTPPSPTVPGGLSGRAPIAPPKSSAPSQVVDRTPGADPHDLENMTVVELRQVARGLKRLHLKGREVSKANKQQLIDAIRRVIDMD
ncbi:MAG: BMC domain-containing protein [candidate division Zixibacteria bacterium]|nr:BMC domain-containing protein [candidate division Zixibacteria bacterium]MDH3938648.1 BMC domain-containing protein [candidate division Zixibacteria bacterium]MDH4032415.1 BMC domain-containing protein [candidate division Zixibacteria bacterium]